MQIMRLIRIIKILFQKNNLLDYHQYNYLDQFFLDQPNQVTQFEEVKS